MSWRSVTLGDLIELKYGKGLSEQARIAGDIPVFGSGGVIGTHNQRLVDGPGIVVGRKGTVGAVYWADCAFFPIDTVYYVALRDQTANLKFVYYLLKYSPLASLNTDAAVPGLNRENALRFRVMVPGPSIQQEIAAILSAYDDLIENNRRRIQLLEQAARLIYQEWFVRLRYPGHEHVRVVDGVPEGWEKKKLGDILVLNYGKGLKESERIEGDVPVYGSSGVVGSHNQKLAEGPGIIVGRKGNVGSVFWSQSAFFPIDTVYYVDSKTSSLYLFHFLQGLPFQSSDGAVPGLNRSYAYSLPVRVPPKLIPR